MCIKKKIAELQQQIDTKIKLKSLLQKTQPLLTSISVICADYRELAPEELPFLMDEILQAAQMDLSVSAISAIAATGDEKAQDFAIDAMTQAIEQRASAVFEVTTEAEGVQQSNSALELEPEYEPEECTDTIQGILGSRGFFRPDVNLADVYDPEDKRDSYEGWDIYCSVHDSGQAMSIGLSNEKLNQFWDIGTEFLADHDPSFPKSLSERQPILTWTRSVINLLKNLETPAQLQLSNYAEDAKINERYRNFNQIFELQDFKVDVRQHNKGDEFAGASFNFYKIRHTHQPTICADNLIYSKSLTADECADKHPKELATNIIEAYWQKLKEKEEQIANPYKKPEDDFVELGYLSDAVAYLKRKDTGEILTAYVAFSNKTPEGHRAPTMAKSRAARWQEHLVGVYQLACSGPRECQRIESKNPKQPFKYELKITKPSLGQLQGLATENFGLYPNEIETKQEESDPTITPDILSDFEFEKVSDFDDLNPEFLIKYKGIELTRTWSSLRATAGQEPQRLWRHPLLEPGEEIELKSREAAAFHVLRRTQGLV